MKGLNILPSLRYRPFQIIVYLSFSFPEFCFSHLQAFYFSHWSKNQVYLVKALSPSFRTSAKIALQIFCRSAFSIRGRFNKSTHLSRTGFNYSFHSYLFFSITKSFFQPHDQNPFRSGFLQFIDYFPKLIFIHNRMNRHPSVFA